MLPQYAGMTSFFGGVPPLAQNVGYAIVLGFGILLCALILVLTYFERRGQKGESSEWFNTAGRSVKTGLTAAVICSQWTWTTTITNSTSSTWFFGVAGAYWHAAGATIQLVLFAVAASEMKRKARNAHTICELVMVRWGKLPHLTFLFFCFVTNIICTACLLLSGANLLNQLTGMNTWLCTFLMPWTIVVYTAAGGLRAKFYADYIHVAVIFIMLVISVYTVYVKTLGSDGVYAGLSQVSSYSLSDCNSIFTQTYPQNPWMPTPLPNSFFSPGKYACGPVQGNRHGSYMTMLSSGGTVYGILQIFSNFGTIFVDQSYWQSAIAAKPSSAGRGFMWGALAWFSIPFSLAMALGLASVALQLPISSAEATAGLVAPAAAQHLLGNSGSVIIGIMAFMAVCSGTSAECLSVSSLFCYDVYRTYFRPDATGAELLFLSRSVVIIYGLGMGALACILNTWGVSPTWLYLLMNIIIGACVFPLWNLVMWKDANGPGAVIAAWLGMALGIALWLIVAAGSFGSVTATSLGSVEAMIAGNVMSLLSGGIIHGWLSLMTPQNYNWKSMDEIKLVEDDKSGLDPVDFTEKKLDRELRWTSTMARTFVFIFVLAWPIWSLPAVSFDQGYFSFWVFISIAWAFWALFFIIGTPLVEYSVFEAFVEPFVSQQFGILLVRFPVLSFLEMKGALPTDDAFGIKSDDACVIGNTDLEAKSEEMESSNRAGSASATSRRGGSPCIWFCSPRSARSNAVAAPSYA